MERRSEAELLVGGGGEPSWLELVGSHNWEGLVDNPVNVSLRRLILRCGNFCEAAYDALNCEKKSPYAGSSNYGKNHFFQKVMLESASDYQVECFLYATAEGKVGKRILTRSRAPYPWDKKANFMGYIATTTDQVSRALGRREIYVVWRGTVEDSEWHTEIWHPCLASADPLLASPENHGCWCTPCGPKVETGFLQIYTSTDPPFAKYSAGQQVKKKIHELREKYRNENLSIIITGHSLGASLSVLSALDLVENEVKDILVSAIVFACPKVGNCAFKNRVKTHQNLKILHIRNKCDVVPCLPCTFLGYANTGTELVINECKSSKLKKRCKIKDWHNLEAMLHMIANLNGSQSQIKRSLALVNKYCDLIVEDELIPDSWWVEEKKGMVRDQSGDWILAPPSEEDMPVPENFDHSSII